MQYSATEYLFLYIIAPSGILSLHFHEDSAKFWSTQLLNVLQSFPLIKVPPLDGSESYTLTTNEQNMQKLPHTNN